MHKTFWIRRKIVFALLFFTVTFFVTNKVLANIGVGIGSSKVVITESLKPGIIYNLTTLPIINTGDQASQYEVGIEYHEGQKEFRPDREWFSIEPQSFYLQPGQVQNVKIVINLPLSVEPGSYFAYLEGRPINKTVAGSAQIGVAVASKLYFTVVSSNLFYAIYYRVLSLWNMGQPWSSRIAVCLGILLVIFILKKFFNIQIDMKRPPKKSKGCERTDRLY